MRLPAAAFAGTVAALLAPGCVTEVHQGGDGAAAAAARAGWATSGADRGKPGDPGEPVSHPDIFDPPKRGADEEVSVPADAYAPVDTFFDNEGYLLADRIEIDCSFEPFRTRMVGLSYEGHGDWVLREEGREGDLRWVRLRNGAPGTVAQAEKIPTTTFGSHSEPPAVVDPATGKVVGVNPRPVFQFVATEELIVRFHTSSPADRPVWFRARAVGTPEAGTAGEPRDSVYMNVNRRRRVKAPSLALSLDLRRDGAGRWSAVIDDPGTPGGAAGGR